MYVIGGSLGGSSGSGGGSGSVNKVPFHRPVLQQESIEMLVSYVFFHNHDHSSVRRRVVLQCVLGRIAHQASASQGIPLRPRKYVKNDSGFRI